MKTLLLSLAMTTALLAAPLHAQTTEDEIKADLLRLQIIAALEAENHAAAADLFDQYEALGVDISPPLQLQRAVVYFRLQRYADAELQLRAYLGRAERGSTDYSQALNMLAEVIAQAAAAEAAAKAAAAAKLEEAMRANDSATVLRLLQNGADVNIKDDNGETLLRWAASGGHTEIAALLLKRGADVNAKNDTGNTPRKVAKLFIDDKKARRAMRKLLRQHGGRE